MFDFALVLFVLSNLLAIMANCSFPNVLVCQEKCVFRHIYVCSTHTQPICCLSLIGVFGMISNLNMFITLKPLAPMTCDFVLVQPLVASEQFCLLNFTHNAWFNMWYGLQACLHSFATWDHLPRLVLSRSYYLDKATRLRFKLWSQGQNTNVLTTWS